MTTLRRFTCDDLFRISNINLDKLTETYNLGFYLQYMSKWPDYYTVAEDPNGTLMGYIMGKAEGLNENWHGHVTALTVAPEYRKIGLAGKFMGILEQVSEKIYDGYFVDLYVRKSNNVAISMYKKFGYTIYRQVIGYYSEGEDAYDMRKALPRDVHKKSIIPLPHPTAHRDSMSSTSKTTSDPVRFSTELWDGFDALCRQTAEDINFLREVFKFVKKRQLIEEEYADKMSKLNSKNPDVQPLGTLSKTWTGITNHLGSMTDIHNSAAIQMTEKVADALAALIKDTEMRRKQVVDRGTELNGEYKTNVEYLKKCKAAYDKAMREAAAVAQQIETMKQEAMPNRTAIAKNEKELQSKNEFASQLEDVYRRRITFTNYWMDIYYNEKMPAIMKDFERLETVMMQMFKAYLKRYANVVQDMQSPTDIAIKTLAESIDQIDASINIDIICRQNKTKAERPPLCEFEPYVVQSAAPQRSKLNPKGLFDAFTMRGGREQEHPASRPAPYATEVKPPGPNSVFGVPLEKLMDRQKDRYPELQIPKVLLDLSESVLKSGGCWTEGIFRVPAAAREVQNYKNELDDTYDAAVQPTNVHVIAAALKLWLREICTETPQQGYEVVKTLPSVNYKVVERVIHMLQEMSKQEYVETTMMDQSNLAMVFAPAFLKCPHTDYSKAMTAADKEKAFIVYLMDNIPSRVFEFSGFSGIRNSRRAVPAIPSKEGAPSPSIALSPSEKALASSRPLPTLPLSSSIDEMPTSNATPTTSPPVPAASAARPGPPQAPRRIEIGTLRREVHRERSDPFSMHHLTTNRKNRINCHDALFLPTQWRQTTTDCEVLEEKIVSHGDLSLFRRRAPGAPNDDIWQ
ncbi:N-acetyltransferase 5 [Planoprotostelium fungivorum]|uniref:N-acetyltransferase 5 n=1 Tax=Planoprotostelium fungivorum TaxID=1890364 RepID=A0A2P6MSW0_9EUKA|nr:N-acetyltransferase 5 [Planoprotostelium fungivorum]